MVAYLDTAGFALRTMMPAGEVEALDIASPGWLATQLETVSDVINSRLRKRYAVPFALDSVPGVIVDMLVSIVTARAYVKRGVAPTDEQFGLVKEQADAALATLKEIADSNEGLYDIPIRDDSTATGATLGGPLGYSEAGPYDAWDRQIEAVRLG